MKRRPTTFISAGVRKMLCNPAYTGIQVHPTLAQHRPDEYDQEKFINIAILVSRETCSRHTPKCGSGAEHCVRELLEGLRHPNPWTVLIPIHESFAWPREAITTEEEFVQAGITMICEMGIEKYFRIVIDNLAQGTLSFGFMPPATGVKQ